MNWCILIPLLTGLLCTLLGYLLGRYGVTNETNNNNGDLRLKISDLEAELENCRSGSRSLASDLGVANSLTGKKEGGEEYKWKLKFKEAEENLDVITKSNTTLKADLEACKDSHSKLEAKLKTTDLNSDTTTSELNNRISSLEAELEKAAKTNETLEANLKIARNISFLATKGEKAGIAFDANAAKAVFGKKIKQDDLTLVEGIGPKIQELFHNHGVKTWKELSECSIEKCQEVLDSGGERFKIHSPNTWPEQARMAYEGLWQKLSDWQDELDGGREVE